MHFILGQRSEDLTVFCRKPCNPRNKVQSVTLKNRCLRGIRRDCSVRVGLLHPVGVVSSTLT